MKRIYIYILLLITLSAVLIAYSYGIFGGNASVTPNKAVPEIKYTYIPKHVHISAYDSYFRNAADIVGYDWTLIAAIAYTESRFDSTAVSDAGACGVMQVMPNTLRGFGVPDSMYMDPRTNIMVATELLRTLDKRFRHVRDKNERINFVLASYNAGYGHILDAMQLARKHGKNRFIWNCNVDSFLIYKSLPEYYTDTLCRNGQFNGWRETLSFVKKVQRNWKRFSRMQQEYNDSISQLAATNPTYVIK